MIKKSPAWMRELEESDHYAADAMVAKALTSFERLLQPARLRILKLTLEKRRLRARLVAIKAAAAADKRRLKAEIKKLRAELWSHAGWSAEATTTKSSQQTTPTESKGSV